MAVIPGSVRVAGFIAPTDSTDTYAVTDENYNRGGYRTVNNTTERDAITTDRRKEGMLVYILSTDEYFILKSGILNANWTAWAAPASGGGGTGTTQTFSKTNADTVTMFKGTPVVITLANPNNIVRGIATDFDLANIAGLVSDDSIILGGSGAILSSGLFEQPTTTWDVITGGSGGLTGGRDYFLSDVTTGRITTTPPTAGYVVKIGKAISSTILDVNVETPIEL